MSIGKLRNNVANIVYNQRVVNVRRNGNFKVIVVNPFRVNFDFVSCVSIKFLFLSLRLNDLPAYFPRVGGV